MAITHGMNVEDVDELGHFLKARADDLDRVASSIETSVRRSSWQGTDADRFRNDWWPRNRATITSAAEAVRGLGQSAHNNATDQRRASQAGAAGGGSGSPTPAGIGANPGGGGRGRIDGLTGDSDQLLADVEAVLELAGLGSDVLDLFVELADILEPGQLLAFARIMADNPGIAEVAKVLGGVLKGANALADFASAMTTNMHLPLDERVVHAAATAAIGLGVSYALPALGKAVGGFVAGVLTGGAAAPVGFFVGGAVGIGAGAAFDFVDSKIGITEGYADLKLAEYRALKAAATWGIDAVRDPVGTVIGAAENSAHLLAEGAIGAADGAREFLGGLW